MPLAERQIETSGDFSKIHGTVLEALNRMGYKVQQDSTTKIVAQHSFSATSYGHAVEVELRYGQTGNVIIFLRINHAAGAIYIDRLVSELGGVRTLDFGLLEGEEIKLKFNCSRSTISSPSMWDGKSRQQFNKGMLIFTNDNMIFMQQEGAGNYGQALRFPLESISGLVTGGSLIKHIRIAVGAGGSSEQHEFVGFTSTQQVQDARAAIESLLKVSREEKKRLAVETMQKGTVPTMVFCRFCGTKNKSDQPNCANCGAILT
jgi:hypothetical protein